MDSKLVYVVVYDIDVEVFDEQELAFREAASIAYSVASRNRNHYDFESISEAITDCDFERAVTIFNDTDWIDCTIMVRPLKVQSRWNDSKPFQKPKTLSS